jgi:hypothetical protein
MSQLKLTILANDYTIHQFPEKSIISKNMYNSHFLSISFTENETTVICESNIEINSKKKDDEWTCIKLVGEFDLEIKGVWAKITSIVADAGSPVLAITTYDTDYFLVKTKYLIDV